MKINQYFTSDSYHTNVEAKIATLTINKLLKDIKPKIKKSSVLALNKLVTYDQLLELFELGKPAVTDLYLYDSLYISYLNTMVVVSLIRGINYSICRLDAYGPDYKSSKVALDSIKSLLQIKAHPNSEYLVSVKWAYLLEDGLQFTEIDEVIDENFYNESYPYIDNFDNYVRSYIASESSVLILLGPPGTGKTKLIRKILKEMRLLYGELSVLFTQDKNLIDSDLLYTHCIDNSYDIMILEDIDINLSSRNDGNFTMSKFLTISDGILKNFKIKMILSTNLPSTLNIDDALLRKGRCFDVLKTRKLTAKEAEALTERLGYKRSFSREEYLCNIYNFTE